MECFVGVIIKVPFLLEAERLYEIDEVDSIESKADFKKR
jgi:hypothetical protein